MARLWHTILLANWKDIFEFIPLESQIDAFQNEYYNAISECNKNGDSNAFIEFILTQIDHILDDILLQIQNSQDNTSIYVRRLLNVMETDIAYQASELLKTLGLKSRETFRKNYLNPAIEQGLVRMTIPEKPNSRNQRYIRI